MKNKTSWKDLLTAGSLSFRILVATAAKTQQQESLISMLGWGQWVLPQLTRLRQRVKWRLKACHKYKVMSVWQSSSEGGSLYLSEFRHGAMSMLWTCYLLPWPWHKDRSRHLTPSPSVWCPDHHLASRGCFHFREIFMGRHLLEEWKKKSLAFELNSFSPSPSSKAACYMLKP